MYQYDYSDTKKSDDSIIRLVYHGNGKHIRLFKYKLNYIIENLKNKKKIEIHLIYDLNRKKIKKLK